MTMRAITQGGPLIHWSQGYVWQSGRATFQISEVRSKVQLAVCIPDYMRTTVVQYFTLSEKRLHGVDILSGWFRVWLQEDPNSCNLGIITYHSILVYRRDLSLDCRKRECRGFSWSPVSRSSYSRGSSQSRYGFAIFIHLPSCLHSPSFSYLLLRWFQS